MSHFKVVNWWIGEFVVSFFDVTNRLHNRDFITEWMTTKKTFEMKYVVSSSFEVSELYQIPCNFLANLPFMIQSRWSSRFSVGLTLATWCMGGFNYSIAVWFIRNNYKKYFDIWYLGKLFTRTNYEYPNLFLKLLILFWFLLIITL